MRVAAFLAVLSLGACARVQAQAPVQVVAVENAEEEPATTPAPAPMAEAPAPDASIDLPADWLRVWHEPIYADVWERARRTRSHYTVPAADAGADRAWFGATSLTVDQTVRLYAAAFNADDARNVDRVEAIAAAAELALRFADDLDASGLSRLPREWHTDKALGLSFEDVNVGPSKRWRDEGRTLARACVSLADQWRITSTGSEVCAKLRPGRVHADASTCACKAGDPLCSTMGGFCP